MKPQTVNILVFGKVGSGKTSIASAIAARDTEESSEGWESGTRKTIRVKIAVGNVILNVFDTRGTMHGHESRST